MKKFVLAFGLVIATAMAATAGTGNHYSCPSPVCDVGLTAVAVTESVPNFEMQQMPVFEALDMQEASAFVFCQDIYQVRSFKAAENPDEIPGSFPPCEDLWRCQAFSCKDSYQRHYLAVRTSYRKHTCGFHRKSC